MGNRTIKVLIEEGLDHIRYVNENVSEETLEDARSVALNDVLRALQSFDFDRADKLEKFVTIIIRRSLFGVMKKSEPLYSKPVMLGFAERCMTDLLSYNDDKGVPTISSEDITRIKKVLKKHK